MAIGQSGRSCSSWVRSDVPAGKLPSAPLLYNPSQMPSGAKIATRVFIVLAFAIALRSEPVSQLHPTDYVNDFAKVLDQATIAQLDDICRQIDEQAHAQIAVVTVQSLDGSDIESYAADLYKKWGIGSKATNHGVLILVASQDHRYRIEVGYGLEPILPDGKVGGFGREAVPLLRQGDYNGAVSLMVWRVAEVIAQDAGIQLTGTRPAAPATRPQEPDQGLSPGWIAILIFVAVIILMTRVGRSLLLGFLLGGGGWGGRGGSWGGGGFGGGGGGGGFGGFGGGSSGGGGASGSW
jgi:uncharacterized protein